MDKTHNSRLGAIVIDCETEDLAVAGEFWSVALGLRAESVHTQSNEKYLRLEGEPGEPQVLLQKVDHPSRVHLDIESDNIEAEVARLQAIGARVVEVLERWTVMEAPSGHRFCVIGPVRDGFDEGATSCA